MEISSLEYCDVISKVSHEIDQIAGGRLANTFANAQTFDGGATATAGAIAIGSYSKTYTSTRTSGRSNRHGSVSGAVAGAYASARLGTETDVSSSLDGSLSSKKSY